jgi:YVTN family beta-propeller protein
MTRASHRFLALFLIATLLLAGCDLTEDSNDPTLVTEGVVVANSGTFGGDGGPLTVYNPLDATATDNPVTVSFIHSLALQNDRLYVVDNAGTTSGRITLLNPDTFERVGQLQSTRAPRSFAAVSDAKGYATNITFDANFAPVASIVSVFDLTTETLVDSIGVGVAPEGIAVTDGKAFVANSGGTTLSIIDTSTDAVTATLDLGCTAPNEVFVDDENEVVVVCQGSADQNAEVLFVDPASEQVQGRLTLDTAAGSANGTQSAFYAAAAEELYVLEASSFQPPDFAFVPGTTIYRITTEGNARAGTLQVPDDPALTGMTAVGYDAVNEALHVARLPVNDSGGPSFQTEGRVVVLNREGALVDQYGVGVSPAHIELLLARQ